MSDKTDKLITDMVEARMVGMIQVVQENAYAWHDKGRACESALRAEIARIESERDNARVALNMIDEARAAALQRVDELERERRSLWRQTDANEGTLLTYCAVHAVRWQSSWGEPSCGFIQAEA